MKRLRLLQLDHVQLSGDYGYFKQLVIGAVRGFLRPYSLKSSRLSTFGDDVSTSPVKSDARLVPESIKDIVYDVNSAPLVNFHHYERLQQEVSYKPVVASMVLAYLILRLPE